MCTPTPTPPVLQPGRTFEKVLPGLHPAAVPRCTAPACPAVPPKPKGKVSPSSAVSHESGTNPWWAVCSVALASYCPLLGLLSLLCQCCKNTRHHDCTDLHGLNLTMFVASLQSGKQTESQIWGLKKIGHLGKIFFIKIQYNHFIYNNV